MRKPACNIAGPSIAFDATSPSLWMIRAAAPYATQCCIRGCVCLGISATLVAIFVVGPPCAVAVLPRSPRSRCCCGRRRIGSHEPLLARRGASTHRRLEPPFAARGKSAVGLRPSSGLHCPAPRCCSSAQPLDRSIVVTIAGLTEAAWHRSTCLFL